MASAKNATLTFHFEPDLKEAIRLAAVNKSRSIANMTAVVVRDYCERVGFEIREPKAPGPKVARKIVKTGARTASS